MNTKHAEPITVPNIVSYWGPPEGDREVLILRAGVVIKRLTRPKKECGHCLAMDLLKEYPQADTIAYIVAERI